MNFNKKTGSGSLLILLAGTFWGSMGIFSRAMNRLGLTSPHVAMVRFVLGALIFAVVLAVTDRAHFWITRRDIPLFLGLGIGSVLFFSLCYFRAIELMPLATAAILLYTSPIWVMLLSSLLFHERLTARKLVALALAFGGCVLVSGISGGGLSAAGLLVGLGAGFGYAMYSILATVALRRYPPLTVTTWTFVFAALGSLLVCDLPGFATVLRSAPAGTLLWLIPVATLITAVTPYLSYTKGLQRTEPGRAAILATVEPVVAALFGVFIFHERPTLTALVGIALVLAAIAVLNPGARK